MTLPRLLLAAAVVLASVAGAAAKPGFATSTVNLRAEPNTTSDVLVKIRGGSPVDVGECKDGWCQVAFGGKSGFAIATALDTTGRPPHQATRRPPGNDYAYEDDGDVVRGPAPPGYVRVPAPGAYVAPRPYYYGPYYGPYWGPWGYRRWYW